MKKEIWMVLKDFENGSITIHEAYERLVACSTINKRDSLVDFLDSIKSYEHESGNSIYSNERESSEIVDSYLKSLTTTPSNIVPCDCKKHSVKTNYGFELCIACGHDWR